jgi:hypothetical protein
MPEVWNSSGGSPGWGFDVSTASEQPGPGLPEENAEPAEAAESADSAGPAEIAEIAEAVEVAEIEAVEPAEVPAQDAVPVQDAVPGAAAAADLAADPAEETEAERVARERVEFDKLVAAFHSESAPDPQPNRPSRPDSAGTRKIIRYPVLEPRPEWRAEVVEPADETTIDPLDHVEHYEQPDPPLPRIASATLAAGALLTLSVGFLVLHTLLGLQTPDYFSWLAVIGVCGGVFSLVSRMKPDRDEYDDPDNGAVV